MKRIGIIVFCTHALILLWMALWMPVKRIPKKAMVVRTVVQAPLPPPKEKVIQAATSTSRPVAKKKPTPTKKPKPASKKTAVKPKPVAKKPLVSASLAKQLEESIAKLEQKPQKTTAKPKITSKLTIDQASIGEADSFAAALVKCLQNRLDLPEMGAVKIALVLQNNGAFVKMQVIHSASRRNERFLESELPALSYPPFSGSLKQKKEHTFVITFCNE